MERNFSFTLNLVSYRLMWPILPVKLKFCFSNIQIIADVANLYDESSIPLQFLQRKPRDQHQLALMSASMLT
jgi:hypothetical protein